MAFQFNKTLRKKGIRKQSASVPKGEELKTIPAPPYPKGPKLGGLETHVTRLNTLV